MIWLFMQMFGPDAEPLVWDKDGEYSRDSIIVYYLAYAGRPFTRVSASGGSVEIDYWILYIIGLKFKLFVVTFRTK